MPSLFPHKLSFCALLLLFAQCRNPEKPKGPFYPTVTLVEQYKATAFAPEITCNAPKDVNVVYTPTFLFAWDKARDTIGAPVTIIDAASERSDTALYRKGINNLHTINNATSFTGSLSKEEYTTRVTATPGAIDVVASFKQSLAFAVQMKKYTEPFYFKDSAVAAFGMPYYDEHIAGNIRILYYKNDDSFIIKLYPENNKYEIIMAMGLNGNGPTNLSDINNRIQTFTDLGKEEMNKNSAPWKYKLKEEESVVIPVLALDAKADYTDLVSIAVSSSSNAQYSISKAWQSTTFLLNENGAKVQSVAEVELTRAAMAPPSPDEVQHIKKLLFNKPFTLLLRKTGQTHPYFMAKIENTELMEHMR